MKVKIGVCREIRFCSICSALLWRTLLREVTAPSSKNILNACIHFTGECNPGLTKHALVSIFTYLFHYIRYYKVAAIFEPHFNGVTDGHETGTSLAKEAIRKNYTKVQQGLGNPLDVVDYLYSDIDPPLLTETMREDIKVEYMLTLTCYQ